MDEMNFDRLGDLVDAQLRYLRGEGPEPDLSALAEEEQVEVLRMLNLVEALADSLPASPPIENDPVAYRLGLFDARITRGALPQDLDSILVSAEETVHRFGGAVSVQPVPTSPIHPGARRHVLLCRSLAGVVRVVVYDEHDLPTAPDARALFDENPELSAVAFTSADAARAAVVTHGESVDRLIPMRGWKAPSPLVWEPLGIALGRYFDRSIPRWDEVNSLPRSVLLEDLPADARGIVSAELGRIAKTRPHLPHKRHARDFVAGLDAETFLGWIEAVRARRASGEELTAEISRLCRGAVS